MSDTDTAARQRAARRWKLLNEFVDYSLRRLPPAEVRVWLVLFRDTKPVGRARTGQTDIARRTGLSVRTVQRAVRALAAAGLVKVVQVGRLNAGPSVYAVRGAVADAQGDTPVPPLATPVSPVPVGTRAAGLAAAASQSDRAPNVPDPGRG